MNNLGQIANLINGVIANSDAWNHVGLFVLEHKDELFEAGTSKVEAGIKAQAATLIHGPSLDEKTMVRQLRDMTTTTLHNLGKAAANGDLSDAEMIAVAAAYEPSVSKAAHLAEVIQSFLDRYKDEVATIGEGRSGPTGGFGMGMAGHKHAFWVTYAGEQRLALAIGTRTVPIGVGGKDELGRPEQASFAFEGWISEDMVDAAIVCVGARRRPYGGDRDVLGDVGQDGRSALARPRRLARPCRNWVLGVGATATAGIKTDTLGVNGGFHLGYRWQP